MLEPQRLLEAVDAGELEGARRVSPKEAQEWEAAGHVHSMPGNMPSIPVLRAARLACLATYDPARATSVTLSPEASYTLGQLLASYIEQAGAAGINGGETVRELHGLLGTLMQRPPTLDAEQAAAAVELLLERARFQAMLSGHSVPEAGLAQALAECLPAGWPSKRPRPVGTERMSA